MSSFGVMLTVMCLAIFRWPHLNNHLCVGGVYFWFSCAVIAANHILPCYLVSHCNSCPGHPCLPVSLCLRVFPVAGTATLEVFGLTVLGVTLNQECTGVDG